MLSAGQSWQRELAKRAPHERALGMIVMGRPVGRDIRLPFTLKGERLPKGWIPSKVKPKTVQAETVVELNEEA